MKNKIISTLKNFSEYNPEIPTLVIRSTTCQNLLDPFKTLIETEKNRLNGKSGFYSYTCWVEEKPVPVHVLSIDKEKDIKTNCKELRAAINSMVLENNNSHRENEVQLTFISKFSNLQMEQLLKTALLSTEKFDKYLTDVEDSELSLSILTSNVDELKETYKRAQILSSSISHAKFLVNEPANTMTPTALSTYAQEMGKKYGFTVEVKNKKEIEEIGMHAYLSVAKGSDEEPKFILMRINNNPSDKKLALVGKGLTYDSGGYAIKPTSGMLDMHCDMGGSAAVIGAMCAIAQLNLKVNVIALVAACENMISGSAYRNGDILNSLSGKTIEVKNTDAEGRLTLADAVNYAASREKATHIIDIATLTGAALVALGEHYTAVLSDCDEMFSILSEVSQNTTEKIWRLPHDEEFAELNKSKRADIANTGGRFAGTITAGLFIREFAEGTPWMHLDIAGTAYHDSDDGLNAMGATGAGVELLAKFAEKIFE